MLAKDVKVELNRITDQTGKGYLMVGSELAKEIVYYDTATQGVAIVNKGVTNTDFFESGYDTKLSMSKQKGSNVVKFVYGQDASIFHGTDYSDTMCLVNNSTCVSDMPFYSIDKVDGDHFDANGVVGLAPTTDIESDNRSFINVLHNQGIIKDRTVALNFED